MGFVEAADRDSATAILASHDLFVLSVVSADGGTAFESIEGFLGRVRRKDLIIFTRQLATLLEARLPLNNALKILYEQTTNQVLKTAISQVTEDIDAGVSFSQAMGRQGKIFPDYYIEMVRAAEVTGNLNEVAAFLADYTEKEGDLASKAASALVYPGIVIGLFIIVAFILLTFVYPSLGGVFAENGVSLPWYTQILLTIGNFLSKWWIAVVIAAVALGALGVNYARTEEGEALLDEAKIRLPIVKKVYLPVIMARFGNSAALLVHGGIPIAQALEIIGHMVGNSGGTATWYTPSPKTCGRGRFFLQSIAKYEYFAPLVSQMVAVGETTGKIEEMFTRLSGIYTREANQITNNLVDLIQPVLMIGIGLMVGLLFASVLLPLYSLTESVH